MDLGLSGVLFLRVEVEAVEVHDLGLVSLEAGK